jgi:hypothetical protein
MNEVSTTATSDTQQTRDKTGHMPPIACTPWCEDGTGHTDAGLPEDQYCSAGYLVMDLTREDLELLGDTYYRPELTVTLNRDPFTEPFISSHLSAVGGIKLSLTEARQYALHILHLTDMAEASR